MAGKATRNSQSSEITQIPIPELLNNKDFFDLIKKTIKKTIREEMQELKQEFAKLSKQVESNETNIVSLQIETERKNQQINDLEKRLKTQEDSTDYKTSATTPSSTRGEIVYKFLESPKAQENRPTTSS